MEPLPDSWWQIAMTILILLWAVSTALFCIFLNKLKRAVKWNSTTSTPMEACWEDIGTHGRYLTDLGGMSIKMREQMFKEFCKALNKPIAGAPAAGSCNDILADLDEWLTKQERKY